MKSVAIVYDCFFPASTGGGERVYRAMAERFVERGYVVDYITRDFGNIDAPNGVRVVPVWNGEIYDSTGTRTLSSAIGFARGVARHVRARGNTYDLIVASALPVLTLLACRWGLRGRSTPLVGDWLEVWSGPTWRRYAGTLAGTVAHILQWVGARAATDNTVNSQFTASRLTAVGARPPLVLGLVDLVDQQPPTGLPSTPETVLAVGRHIPDKQFKAIPGMIAELRRRGWNATATIVGAGPSTADIVDAIHKHRVDNYVRLTGRVDDEELSELYRRSAALVLPSKREGFGLVVAEAASFGVPSVVVAADDNAAVELIEPGRNGAVSLSSEPADLADAVESVWNSTVDMRASTAAWFADARIERSLTRSVDALIDRVLH